MVKKILRQLFIFNWLFISLSACAQKKPNAVIAFYNVENLFDTADDPNKDDDDFTPLGSNGYTDEVYRKKLHNMAMVIDVLGKDVNQDGAALIGMAEVENNKVLTDLAKQPEIKNRNYKYAWFESADIRGIDVALIYQPKYFTLIQAKPIPVSLYVSGGKAGTRDILYVYGKLSGEPVHILINHWPSRRGGEKLSAPKRAVIAHANKHIADSLLASGNAKLILMGDLNDNPTDVSIAGILNAKETKEDVKPNELYNPYTAIYKSGKGTAIYSNHWDLFDQIMLSGNLLQPQKDKWIFKNAQIYNPEFMREPTGRYKGYPYRSFSKNKWTNGYSDHFPVMITLEKY